MSGQHNKGTAKMGRTIGSVLATSLLTLSLWPLGGAQVALARTSHPAKDPSNKAVTTTTVMGGGNPATWPAAKPKPPSLAGAYSPNMKTAFLALVRYSDWVGTHPNPKLVKLYASPTSDIYAAQVYLMTQMKKRGWHLPPTPTEIDFLVTVKKPQLRRTGRGRTLILHDRHAYTSGTVDVVIDQVTEAYLNAAGRTVGHTSKGNGPKAWTVTLAQNDRDGQFVISGYYAVVLRESLAKWEQQMRRRT